MGEIVTRKRFAGYALGIKAGLDWGRAQGGLKTIEYLKSKTSFDNELKVRPFTDGKIHSRLPS